MSFFAFYAMDTFEVTMLKYLFASIFLIHGLLHFLGFFKSIRPALLQQITKEIGRLAGWAWMFTAILFILSFLLWLTNNPNWYWICMVAVVVSQVLVFKTWKDTKWATVINLVLLLAALSGFGSVQFKNKVALVQNALVGSAATPSKNNIVEDDLKDLPPMVQKWLKHSGVINKPHIRQVHLNQTGQMKLKPNGSWLPFRASQLFTTHQPGFVWDARVSMFTGVFFTGLDRFEQGIGSMEVKLLGWVPFVNENNNSIINSGTAQRFLAEICWFPSVALEPYLKWKTLDSSQALATFTYGQDSAQGIFTFDQMGQLVSFETDRYYGGNKDAKKEKWVIKITGHGLFEGLHVPDRMNVTWKLKEGAFTWLELRVTDIHYQY